MKLSRNPPGAAGGAAAEEHQLDKGRKDGEEGRGTGYCRDSAGSRVSIRVAPLKKQLLRRLEKSHLGLKAKGALSG